MASRHGTKESSNSEAASRGFDTETRDYEGRTTYGLDTPTPTSSARQRAARNWPWAILTIALICLLIGGAHHSLATVLAEARAIAPAAQFASSPLWTMDGWNEVNSRSPVRLSGGALGRRYVLTTGRGKALVWAATPWPLGFTDWSVIAAIDALEKAEPPKKVATFAEESGQAATNAQVVPAP